MQIFSRMVLTRLPKDEDLLVIGMMKRGGTLEGIVFQK